MLQIIQIIGYVLVLLLCLFSIYILYFVFRGDIKESEAQAKCSLGGRLLDRTAWGMNGLACLWIVLRHRRRLFGLVELSLADNPDQGSNFFKDSGTVVTRMEGMVLISHLAMQDTEQTLYVRRPFQFLERDWMESMGFRRDDGRVT